MGVTEVDSKGLQRLIGSQRLIVGVTEVDRVREVESGGHRERLIVRGYRG